MDIKVNIKYKADILFFFFLKVWPSFVFFLMWHLYRLQDYWLELSANTFAKFTYSQSILFESHREVKYKGSVINTSIHINLFEQGFHHSDFPTMLRKETVSQVYSISILYETWRIVESFLAITARNYNFANDFVYIMIECWHYTLYILVCWDGFINIVIIPLHISNCSYD